MTHDCLLETLASVRSSSVLVAVVRETECFFENKNTAVCQCSVSERGPLTCTSVSGGTVPTLRRASVPLDGATRSRALRERDRWGLEPSRWEPFYPLPRLSRVEGDLRGSSKVLDHHVTLPPASFPRSCAGPTQLGHGLSCRWAVLTPRAGFQKRPEFRIV